MEIKKENYIVIQGWMVSDLQLKGNELLMFAIIYGFSQDGGEYTGSLSYISDWCGCDKTTTIRVLKSLCEKELITKRDEFVNGVKFCRYKHNTNGGCKISLGVVAKCNEGGCKMQHNNIDNIIEDNTKTKKKKKIEEFDYSFVSQEYVDAFSMWLQYKIERKQSYNTQQGVRLAYDKLVELSGNDASVAMEIVKNSIANNWSGLFPLRNGNQKDFRTASQKRDDIYSKLIQRELAEMQ